MATCTTCLSWSSDQIDARQQIVRHADREIAANIKARCVGGALPLVRNVAVSLNDASDLC